MQSTRELPMCLNEGHVDLLEAAEAAALDCLLASEDKGADETNLRNTFDEIRQDLRAAIAKAEGR